MYSSHFIAVFQRDLAKLCAELDAYPDEALLWKITPGISNSAGNLALHVAGNLSHFVGRLLGKTSFVRDREKEFSLRNVPRAQLTGTLAETSVMLEAVLQDKDAAWWASPYPGQFPGGPLSIHAAMLQLLVHLNYHLGQVNYHRRLCHLF